jgi:precorrin-2/cobalt-factor-2 C20-methyltransferase
MGLSLTRNDSPVKPGVLYGVGVGPGDPELITLKGARILEKCRCVFVPKAHSDNGSIALGIAGRYLRDDSSVCELVFPMSADKGELARRWEQAARSVADVIGTGEDACFLTLGDPLLYSTWIYLVRSLRKIFPGLEAVTVPGITAFCAAAAMAEFPIGEGRKPVVIIPASDDLDAIRDALAGGGTVVLMKVGRRLEKVLDLIEQAGFLDHAVYVERAGLEGQRVEADLRKLKQRNREADYLSILLVHTGVE